MKMKRIIAMMLTFIMVFALSGVSVLAKDVEKKVVAYLPCWESRPWEVEDIKGDALTHIYLSFARIDNNFQISNTEARLETETNQPFPDFVTVDMIAKDTFAKVEQLKKKYPHLKFIITVGGWDADGFSDMVANPANRAIFVDSVVEYLKKYNLDGIELDWEYPVNGAWGVIKSRPEDKDNFTALLKELRAAIGDKELGFCGAVGGWIPDCIDFAAVEPYVNSINLMTYDMHGQWDDGSYHSSALYPSSKDPVVHWGLTVSETVDRYLGYGVPAEKIVVGMPFYGKEYRNIEADENGNGLFQPFKKDAEGNKVVDTTSWRGGAVPYRFLEKYFVNKNGFTRYWDDEAKMPYLFDGQTFISYEDSQSVTAKGEYAKEKGLGGVMFWDYSHDLNGLLTQALYDSYIK